MPNSSGLFSSPDSMKHTEILVRALLTQMTVMQAQCISLFANWILKTGLMFLIVYQMR
jgi:hypothetical protein